MKKYKQKKGFVLVVAIILTFFISSLALTAFTFVYRYTGMLEKQKIELREDVK